MPNGTSPTNRVKSVGVISKPAKPELAQILPNLFKWFRDHDYTIVIDRETASTTRAPKSSIAKTWRHARSTSRWF